MMNQKLVKKTAVFSLLYSVIVMAAVFFVMENRVIFAENRHGDYAAELALNDIETEIPDFDILIDDIHNQETIPRTEGLDSENDLNSDAGLSSSLIFELGSANTNFLIIPLPPGTNTNDITIENHYLNEEMWIFIKNADEDFYANNVISGNRKNITSGFYEGTDNDVILKFALNNIYEYRSIMEEETIYVEFVPPREMYDRIVVIDPAFGGSDFGIIANDLNEKDVTLNIALKLKELLDQTDIKVYFTRLLDNNLNEDKRVRVANNTRADMLIRIECDGDDDSLLNGTTAIYNENFFIPHFGNVELANILEKEVVLSIRGKAIGLKPASQTDSVIANATVPAAAIRVGYLTNAQEAILLNREDYIEKVAAGIYNAIFAAYEMY
ncbi:MAG: N-acetylmuramoyl-L-alanine amidase [Lachnospiraceae bacterium]|nr:N-acetylmuramoyl-L-alanine amidase [Lachnospiraceae bacterium]